MAEGEARWKLILDGADFEEALDALGEKVQEFITGFGAAALAVGAFAEVESAVEKLQEGIGEVIPQLEELTASSAEFSKNIEELSTRTGESADALQALGVGANLVGLSMDQAAMAVNRMQKAIETGSKGFALLGVSAQDLKGLAPEDQFQAIANAIAAIQDPAERSAASMQIFGKAGAALLPLMIQNLSDINARAQELGIIVPEATQQAAAAMGTSLAWLSQTEQGFFRNIGDVFASSPEATAFVDELTNAIGMVSKGIQDATPAIQAFFAPFFQVGTQALQIVEELASSLSTMGGADGLKALLETGSAGFSAATGSLSFLGLQMPDFVGQLEADRDAAQEFYDVLVKIHDWSTGPLDALVNGSGNLPRIASGSGTLNLDTLGVPNLGPGAGAPGSGMKLMQDLTPEYKTAEQETTAYIAALKEVGDVQAQLEGGLQGAIDKINIDTQSKVENVKGTDAMANATRALIQQLGGLQIELAQQKYQTPAWGQSMKDVLAAHFKLQDAFGADNTDIMGQFGQTQAALDANGGLGGLNVTQLQAYGKQLGQEFMTAITNGMTTTSGGGQGDDIASAFEEYIGQAISSSTTLPELQAIQKQLEEIGSMSPSGLLDPQTWDDLAAAAQKQESILDGMGQKIDMGNGFWTQYQDVASGGIDKTKQATDSVNTLANGFGVAAQALTGLDSVMKMFGVDSSSGIGEAVKGLSQLATAGQDWAKGNYVGAVVSGLEGLASVVQGLFTTPEYDKVMQDVGTHWGLDISESLAKQIASTETTDNVSRFLAELLNLGDIMKEGISQGMDPGDFYSHINDLMQAIKDGAVNASEGVTQLSTAFQDLETAATAGSQESADAMVQMILRLRQLGESVPDVSKYVTQQMQGATTGVTTMVQGVTDYAAGGGKVDQSLLQDNATIFANAFWADVASEGLITALNSFSGSFKQLQTLFPGGKLPDFMAPIAQMEKALSDPRFKGTAEEIQGSTQAFQGVSQAGYLTQDAFQSAEDQARQEMQQLIAEGMTQAQAEQSIAPYLSQIQASSQEYGYKIDAQTSSLISQSEKDGVGILVDPANKTNSLLQQILGVLQGHTGVAGAGTGTPGAFGANAPAGYSGGGTGRVIPQLATGAFVTRPTLSIVGERGPEYVIPADGVSTDQPGPLPGGPGGGGGVGININITHAPEIHIDSNPLSSNPKEAAQWLADNVAQAVRVSAGTIVPDLVARMRGFFAPRTGG